MTNGKRGKVGTIGRDGTCLTQRYSNSSSFRIPCWPKHNEPSGPQSGFRTCPSGTISGFQRLAILVSRYTRQRENSPLFWYLKSLEMLPPGKPPPLPSSPQTSHCDPLSSGRKSTFRSSWQLLRACQALCLWWTRQGFSVTCLPVNLPIEWSQIFPCTVTLVHMSGQKRQR